MKRISPQAIGSLLWFSVAWTSVSIIAAACMYLRPTAVLAGLGVSERSSGPFLGLLSSLGQLILFWVLAAVGQWAVLRHRLPHGARWGVVTFVGGLVATFGYAVAGHLLEPWVRLFGVRVSAFGLTMFFFEPDYLHETLFLAVQGAALGGILASFQSLVSPFRWRGRLYLIALSAFAAGAALDLVWLVAASVMMTPGGRHSGMVLRVVGLATFVSPLLWVVYSAIVGIGLHLAIRRWHRSKEDAITSSFD